MQYKVVKIQKYSHYNIFSKKVPGSRMNEARGKREKKQYAGPGQSDKSRKKRTSI